MLASTRQWFRRHRTKFAVGAGTLGLAYLAGQYAWSKWLEARQRMAEDRIAKENLRRRFEQNQEDCTYTVLALLPTIREEIINELPVEELTNELQRQKTERLARSTGASEAASTEYPSAPPSIAEDDRASLSSFQGGSYMHTSQMTDADADAKHKRRTKAQLWYDMKINSITRALTLLYTLCLLTLLTRIQLNLLGRRTYLSSVVSLATPQPTNAASHISLENNDDDNYDNVYGNDFETNRKYLTYSWWLLHRGTKQILERVRTAVKEVFGSINPREDVSLERLSNLILEIRKKVEGATEEERKEMKWLSYLLPPRDQEDFVLQESGMLSASSPAPEDSPSDPLQSSQGPPRSTSLNPSLRRLLDETSDLIDSPTFTHVLTLILNATFSHLIDQRIATEAFKIPASTTTPLSIPRITDLGTKCKLAQTLAVFCRQAHVIAAGSSEPDDFLGTTSAGNAQQQVANEYLADIDRVGDLEAFAAVIYSSNFEFEGVEEEAAKERAAAMPNVETTLESATTALAEVEVQAKEATQESSSSEAQGESMAESAIVVESVPLEASAEMTDAPSDTAGVAPINEPAEEAPAPAPNFESAWKKALAEEDGIA